MGGPSRESYQAAEKARRRRLDAMRTRGGLVDLAEWRVAVRAAQWIEVIFETAPSFLGARVALAERAGFELHVVLQWDDRQLPLCFPSSVNEVPVVVDVRDASRPRDP
jgi:hypothetical protein